MPASRTRQGVTKSGSPMLSEMASGIDSTSPKKRRIGEGGSSCARRAIRDRQSIGMRNILAP